MPRTRQIGLDLPQRRFLGYLQVLIERDPLTHEFLRFPDFDKLYFPDAHKAHEGYCEYLIKLHEKWNVLVWPFTAFEQVPEVLREEALTALGGSWPPKSANEFERYCELLLSKGIHPTGVSVKRDDFPLHYTFNRGCVGPELARNWPESREPGILPGFLERGGRRCVTFPRTREDLTHALVHAFDDIGQEASPQSPLGELSHTFQCFGVYGRPLDEIHTVNIEVDLGAITHRNLQDLAADITKILRTALRYANSKHRTPNELNFLRTITPMAFQRAVMAYDLHMSEALTLAQIARRERRSPSRVEEDVKKIYRAIHRKGYVARRRRLDTPAEGIEPYRCPAHKRDCPEGCQYMNDWITKLNPLLPSDTTGTPRRIR